MKKKKIRVTRYVNPHYHAGCNQCDFSAGIRTDETPETEDVIRAVRQHVRKTGHNCWVESGNHTDYELVEVEEN
jgi:hypothetical protein